MKKHTQGFTLIELLTVIAIIGILAAILIPVVGKVRENANQSKCMNHMRQVALGVLAFESENGVLPGPIFRRVRRPIVTDEYDNRELNWVIESYVGGTRSEVWDCPTNGMMFDSALNPGSVTFLLNNCCSNPNSPVSTNPPRLFGYPNASQENNGFPKSLQQIIAASSTADPIGRNFTELSQIWMITDADGLNYGSGNVGGSVEGGSVPLGDGAFPVHNMGRNYVFFDGHAEYRKMGDFPR